MGCILGAGVALAGGAATLSIIVTNPAGVAGIAAVCVKACEPLIEAMR